MPNQIKLRVKNKNQVVAKSKEDLRAKVPKVALSRLQAAARELKKRMSVAGKPMKYPANWDSEKQKIKVLIKLRKAKNLPYKRTDAMQQGWKVDKMVTGYTVKNLVRGNRYVYGDPNGLGQSSLHSGRWPLLRRQAEIVINALPEGMKRAMVALAKVVVVDANGKAK